MRVARKPGGGGHESMKRPPTFVDNFERAKKIRGRRLFEITLALSATRVQVPATDFAGAVGASTPCKHGKLDRNWLKPRPINRIDTVMAAWSL